VHHAKKSYVRVTIGTRAQNERCAAALERVVSRSLRELPRAFVTAGGDAE
jgi:hypothetical protein